MCYSCTIIIFEYLIMPTKQELMAYIASLPSDRPIALMANIASDSIGQFYGGIKGQASYELPVANILHNKGNLTANPTFYLNYKPSALELGMVWRAGKIKNVFFVEFHDPLVIGQYKIDVDGFRLCKPCELTDVKLNNNAQQKALEKSEPQLKDALISPFNKRILSPDTTRVLGRGLDIIGPIADHLEPRKIDEDFIRLVCSLVDRGWNSKDAKIKPEDRVSGNNIGAIMVDKDNNIIGWGLNLKSQNKTYHAETLMIQRYLKENKADILPEGVRIYTSLECCHMCSGHITTLGKNVKVVYAQKDPYFKGENTLALEENGCSQKPTTIPYPAIFKKAMEDKEQILDFLFSSKSREIFSKGYQQAALHIELLEAVAKRMHDKVDEEAITPDVSPILQYGERFLEALGNYAPRSSTAPQADFFCSRASASSNSSPYLSSESKVSRPV